ncbi:hypothetical protein CNEO4_400014 [Clostridium neonatale]|nr:hypothetical protein CNEO4_240141 [Clostridium neonatale]CAI3621139.1 hypothetical protein CNEO3_270069 [Clostridium neonatale]CAI3633034.1 hypothetical protein CNEO4_330067 [Clostridium neonatale]CAI3639498.1 hypothetical protein CNEO4_330068 [Clostridium neonatale]CAI3657317.1 hypothetical protein CNEO4_350068 [Clostridium neonatale]
MFSVKSVSVITGFTLYLFYAVFIKKIINERGEVNKVWNFT